ncbi:MAG: ATP-grasp fold amidoligase family protein, partial [Muribaculaceae bacterium]
MRPIRELIKDPRAILLGLMSRTAALWPDKLYLKIVYRLYMGKPLNLRKPRTYPEKLNWLKVNLKDENYTKLVDKYEVKKYVAEKLGGNEHIIKNLGIWESFDDIDFDKLPNQFVLKTTNGGGNSAVVICRDKTSLDRAECRKKLKLVSGKKYLQSREYPYYKVKPRIIAEEFLSTEDNELSDYKFFCFNGEPKFLFVGTERQKEGEEVKFDFYDIEFNHLPIRNGHENSTHPLSKPKNYSQMLEIARKLSAGIP